MSHNQRPITELFYDCMPPDHTKDNVLFNEVVHIQRQLYTKSNGRICIFHKSSDSSKSQHSTNTKLYLLGRVSIFNSHPKLNTCTNSNDHVVEIFD